MKVGSLFSAKNGLTRNASIARNVSIATAFALVLLAATVVVCIAVALAVPGDSRKGLGNVFLNAYGLLSFLVPAWFVWGATILWSPVFSPRAIFALDTSIVPFFTLAAGFYHTREFARFAENSPVLTVLGPHGFSVTIVAIALMETVIIGALAYKLFPHTPMRRKEFRYPVPPKARKTTLSEADLNERLRTGTILDFAEDHPDMPSYTEPFTVIRNPLYYGEIPLVKEPALPNPVDDVILEADPAFTASDNGPDNDLLEDLLCEPGIAIPEGAADGDLHDTPDVADGTDTPDVIDTTNVINTTDVINTIDAIESLSPALTDLDMVLNDLLAEMPQNAPDERAALDARDAPVERVHGLDSPHTPDTREELDERGATPVVLDDFSGVIDKDAEPVVAEVEPLDELGEVGTLDEPDEPEECGELEEPTLAALDAPMGSLVPPIIIEETDEATPDVAVATDCAFDEPAEQGSFTRPLPHAAPYRVSPVNYEIPIEGILKEYPDGQYWIIDDATRDAARILKETLFEFNIEADVVGIRKGPVITMFEVLPAPGVKLSRIVNLQDNIAMRLAAASVRIVAPIPGKHAVGIEIPNAKRNIVSFRELIEDEVTGGGHKDTAKRVGIPVVLGKDVAGEAVTIDLATMPHLLIAGSTGSGKSVCVNTLILSILYRRHPAECRLLLVDPKIVELNLYNDIPHLLAPVITEPKRALQALQYCICEMERRYNCLDSMHVRDIKSYNARIKEQRIAAEHMPYLVVVIDEFADLMATTGKELEQTVARLAAKSRAVGIHLVLATQRPSTDVITGLIKSNVPSRIAFMVAGQIDSRIIIDATGAEKLLGKGDMLYSGAADPFPVRMQGAFVSEEEVERVVGYVKTLGEPDYIDDEIFFDEEDERDEEFLDGAEDPLYEKATEIVRLQGRASASYIQRRLKIGYNRAARLVELMESHGLVGPAQGSKPRELLRAV
ncbi:MAG: DNA translocase FtsK [Spirochaetaceae bacterium]|jgi:S-DNA-T family DNA segregation ATPase FtsK/SpoIIIE|nr:DNA translocase FtsK [Spirochaetaceae bacterium]